MKVSKLSTTVDWAVDKFHFGRLLGINQVRPARARTTSAMSPQALPVDNFPDFRAGWMGA